MSSTRDLGSIMADEARREELHRAFESGWQMSGADTQAQSDDDIRKYFSRASFEQCFGECAETDADLAAMADAIIAWRDSEDE